VLLEIFVCCKKIYLKVKQKFKRAYQMSPVTIFTDRLFNVFFFSLNYSLHKALQLLKKILNSKRTLEMIQIKIIKNQLRQV